MNFLTEILGSAEELDGTDKNLLELTKKLSSHEANVNSDIDDIYKKYRQWPSKNKKLLSSVTQLRDDIDNLKIRTEQEVVLEITKQDSRIDSLKKQLQQLKAENSLVAVLTEIQEKLLQVQDYEKHRDYEQAAKELKLIEVLIGDLPKYELKSIVESLNRRASQKSTSLIEHIINNELHELLIIKEGKKAVLQTNVLKISKSRELGKILSSLRIFNVLHAELSLFNKFFWQHICKPIISNITNVSEHEDDDFYILTVSVKKTQLQRSYKEVFQKLLQGLKFIIEHLNVNIDDNDSIISYLGKDIMLDFSETLFKETLPMNGQECNKYKEMIDDAKKFERQLVEFGFLHKDDNPLRQYVSNMNNVLANVYTEECSDKAFVIMKKDLHDMIEVGMHCDPNHPLTGDQFPQCYVSKSCIELLNLAKEILEQALLESDFYAARLMCALQSIFYQYGSIVHAHHEKLLQNIPQQVVLFRNNCMYLAHQLAQLNDFYDNRFPPEVLPVPPLFKDQPHQLRTIGGDIFLGYIEGHVKAMERTLQDYKFESNQLSETMCADVSKSIRQCLRQYELLRTVWHKILPHPVYNKTLGYLLNTFCKRIIDTVVNAPDILVTNAESLIEMCRIILARGPKLFTDPDEVNLYVELWQKMNELIFILGANLVQITERWEHGPLSGHFTSEEVRHLIKALFQNTNRRAEALNRIVNF